MSKKLSSVKFVVATAVGLAIANVASAAAVNCADVTDKTSGQECQCTPVYNGKNLVKAKQTDCSSKASSHSCAGQNNSDYEAGSWILLPAGVCDNISKGNFDAIPSDKKKELCDTRIDCTK